MDILSTAIRVFVYSAGLLASHFASGASDRYVCSYYLFEVPTAVKSCSDCYIPLLVTREALEEKRDHETVVLVTFERDSIWETRRQTLKHSELAIDPAARKLKLDGKTYRYQLIANTEPIRLLTNPLGSIPISRISIPINDQTLRESLLRDLATVDGMQRCGGNKP